MGRAYLVFSVTCCAPKGFSNSVSRGLSHVQIESNITKMFIIKFAEIRNHLHLSIEIDLRTAYQKLLNIDGNRDGQSAFGWCCKCLLDAEIVSREANGEDFELADDFA